MTTKANGTCGVHDDGCTKFQLLEQRVDGMEKFIEAHEENQRWHKRWQKSTTVGVYIAVGLLVLRFFMG